MPVDHSRIAVSWLKSFGERLEAGDVEAMVSCLHSDGYLRDILVFGWNNRCLHGHDKIATHLTDAIDQALVRDVKLETGPGLSPEYGRLTDRLPLCAVSAGFTFQCKIGTGRGYFTLTQAESGEWKALVVMMSLTDIRGHEETNPAQSVWGGDMTWGDVASAQRKAVEENPHVLIIGAGQTGLNIAARFKQMRISTLVLETNNRVGDNWRKRYPSLALHTLNKYSSLLYQSYPENWPEFIPRDKLADWMEQYAIAQDLVVWTNSRLLPEPVYDHSAARWTVKVDRAGDVVTLTPLHIIVAAGARGAPHIPTIPDQHIFTGAAIHSSEYHGGKPFAGKRVVVVGAGNTAADICQDLTAQGAQAVTMVQRSGTWVVARESVCTMIARAYPPELPTSVCDLMAMARPMGLMKKLEKCTVVQALEEERETHRGLREAGFNVGNVGKGIFVLWYEGHGGYWFDVGCAQLIRSGQVKVKQGVQVARFRPDSVVFTDGTSLEADAVIFATSYEKITNTMRGVFGDTIMDQVGNVWGLDEEGELRGCYRPTGHPGLWFGAGEWYLSRAFSKTLALQIKAIELGLS